MAITSETAHFTFTSYLSAADALLAVMEDMRTTKRWYRLTGRSPEALLLNGMTLDGEISEISARILSIPGVNRPFS